MTKQFRCRHIIKGFVCNRLLGTYKEIGSWSFKCPRCKERSETNKDEWQK